jgi:hypothetical protein
VFVVVCKGDGAPRKVERGLVGDLEHTGLWAAQVTHRAGLSQVIRWWSGWGGARHTFVLSGPTWCSLHSAFSTASLLRECTGLGVPGRAELHLEHRDTGAKVRGQGAALLRVGLGHVAKPITR